VTNCTLVEPNRMSAARAILGNPAKSPPVLPTLLGIKTPSGTSTRAVRGRRMVQNVVEHELVPVPAAG
jgi:hypothetical protein